MESSQEKVDEKRLSHVKKVRIQIILKYNYWLLNIRNVWCLKQYIDLINYMVLLLPCK